MVLTTQNNGGGQSGSSNKGYFLSLSDLQTKYPIGVLGESATVENYLYFWNGIARANSGVLITGATNPDGSIISKPQNTAGQQINPSTSEDIAKLMRYLSSLAIKDSSGRQRVTIDTGTVGVTGTLTAVTTVGTITNIPTIGGMGAELLQRSMMRNAFVTSVRNHLSYT